MIGVPSVRQLSLLCLALAAPAALIAQAAGTQDEVSIDRLMSTVRTLASPELEGRGAGTPGGARARRWILDRFSAIGLKTLGGGYEKAAPFTRPARGVNAGAAPTTVHAANLLGLCPGSTASSYIVLSAHYDHVGVRDGAVYPGADDNASGVAVLLEASRACLERPFKHHLLVVAFDAEEAGLQGAKAFLDALPVDRDRIALNVNLDMVARGDKGELYASGTAHTPALKPVLEAVVARPPVKLRLGHDVAGTGHDDWTSQSDHAAFHEAGIPFIYFGVEDHPDYHKPSDTPEKIDPTFFAGSAGTILDALRTLDAALK
jgi:hypothetical protein